jgi:hypothetical protein
MAPFELLAALYFAAFGVVAVTAPAPWRRRGAVLGLSIAAGAAIAALAPRAGVAVREWAPHLYLVAGYWIPGLLAQRLTGPTRFERWLAASDRFLRPRLPALPAFASHLTELAYLLCYPLVPSAFLVIASVGSPADVSRFWVAILAAGYASYATLPWFLSRPPRLGSETVAAPVAPYFGAVNAFVLRRASHGLNTFPSGHVAVSCAAAGALWPVSQTAALVVGAMAMAIAVGAAAGRYHYVIDVGLGIAVAVAAVAASSFT